MQIDVSFDEKRIPKRGMEKNGEGKQGERTERKRMECKCVLKSYHTLMGPSREWKQGEFNCRKKETQSVPRLAFRRNSRTERRLSTKRNFLGHCQDVANSTLRFKNVPHRRESINHPACAEENFETERSAIKRRQFVKEKRLSLK